MNFLGEVSLLQDHLLFHQMGQQFGLGLRGLLEQLLALDETHFKCVHIFSHHPIDDMLQADTGVLRHQEKVEEGAQLVVIGTRGVSPGLTMAAEAISS